MAHAFVPRLELAGTNLGFSITLTSRLEALSGETNCLTTAVGITPCEQCHVRYVKCIADPPRALLRLGREWHLPTFSASSTPVFYTLLRPLSTNTEALTVRARTKPLPDTREAFTRLAGSCPSFTSYRCSSLRPRNRNNRQA